VSLQSLTLERPTQLPSNSVSKESYFPPSPSKAPQAKTGEQTAGAVLAPPASAPAVTAPSPRKANAVVTKPVAIPAPTPAPVVVKPEPVEVSISDVFLPLADDALRLELGLIGKSGRAPRRSMRVPKPRIKQEIEEMRMVPQVPPRGPRKRRLIQAQQKDEGPSVTQDFAEDAAMQNEPPIPSTSTAALSSTFTPNTNSAGGTRPAATYTVPSVPRPRGRPRKLRPGSHATGSSATVPPPATSYAASMTPAAAISVPAIGLAKKRKLLPDDTQPNGNVHKRAAVAVVKSEPMDEMAVLSSTLASGTPTMATVPEKPRLFIRIQADKIRNLTRSKPPPGAEIITVS
jgi:hypothetical protein